MSAMSLPARDHGRGVLGRRLQAFEAKRRRWCESCCRGCYCAACRRLAGPDVVERRGRLRGNQRCPARGFHALDGCFAACDLVRVASPRGRQDGKDAFALRAKYLVPDTGNGLPVDGGGCGALQHAAAVRRCVADADHGSGHKFSRRCGFRMNLPFLRERSIAARRALRQIVSSGVEHRRALLLFPEQMPKALKRALATAKVALVVDVLVDIVEPILHSLDRLSQRQNFKNQQSDLRIGVVAPKCAQLRIGGRVEVRRGRLQFDAAVSERDTIPVDLTRFDAARLRRHQRVVDRLYP